MNNAEQATLAQVGPGTPSGAVFRRYWLPVEASANLGPGAGQGERSAFALVKNPIRVKVLGERLVLFRTGSGQPALVAEHCSHRGTSLYYGRVEDNCLRCMYHGWAYDPAGNCVDQPAEPPTSGFKRTIQHPAYPCIEAGGLIFAYLGPPDRQPAFPRYEHLFRRDGIRVTGNGGRLQRCNVFLQTLDNVLDPWHAEIAHGWFKGVEPVVTMHHGRDGESATPVRYDRTPWGTRYVVLKSSNTPGRYWYHETHAVWPCQRVNEPDCLSIKWAVPIDDFTTRWFGVDFYPFVNGEPTKKALKAINDFGPDDSRAVLPDDWVDQVGQWWNYGHPWRQGQIWEDEVIMGTQGPPERNFLPDWENWHLASSDKGLALQHRVWQEQVERVREGLDPIGVSFDASDGDLIRIPAGRFEVDWDAGKRLFDMSVEERLQTLAEARNGVLP